MYFYFLEACVRCPGHPVPKHVRGVAIFLYFREAAWSCQKSPFRAAGRAVGWPAGWSAGRMAGRPAASRSAGRLAGRPAGLMAGRVVSGVATQPAESCLGRTGPISKSLQSEFLARCPVLRTLMARSHIQVDSAAQGLYIADINSWILLHRAAYC